MNQLKLFTAFCMAAAAFAAAPAGASTSADDPNELRLGSYSVFYHATADDLQGAYVPKGVNIHADNVETLYLGYIRRLSSNFSAELALGWPPLTKTEGKGPATLGSVPYNGQVISTARWFAPAVLVNYSFFDESAAFRPYIGVGVNYTNFYDRNSTAQGNAASGGPTKISLPASWGPTGTIGLSYRIAPRWGAYASYSWTSVKTKLTADTAGEIRTTHISFGPQALIVSIGYSF